MLIRRPWVFNSRCCKLVSHSWRPVPAAPARHHRGALWLRIHFNLCFRRIFLTFLMTRGLSQTPRSSLYGLDIILLIEQSAGGGAFNACCE